MTDQDSDEFIMQRTASFSLPLYSVLFNKHQEIKNERKTHLYVITKCQLCCYKKNPKHCIPEHSIKALVIKVAKLKYTNLSFK
jgi:hypothetical protein